MGREVRTESGQPGWVQLTSGQSHRSAFLFFPPDWVEPLCVCPHGVLGAPPPSPEVDVL